MCGRYTLTAPPEVLADLFDLPAADRQALEELSPRFNIAPSQEVAAVRAGEGDGKGRRFALLRWGLVPHWADDPAIGNRMINARSETAAEKPSFRDSFKKRRCLVMADGFYEWQKVKGKSTKQPWHIRLESGEPFAFAGLWSSWRKGLEKGQEPLETCSLMTTAPNGLVRKIHDRMPVILPREAWDPWLDPDLSDRDILQPLLTAYPAEKMTAWPVSTRVNKPANDEPSVLEPLEDEGEAEPGDQASLF